MSPAGSMTACAPYVSSATSSPPSYSLGPAQEQRRRQVRANPKRRAGDLADRVVDVGAERHAALVAVEERREHAQRQRAGEVLRMTLERGHDRLAHLARLEAAFGDLTVVLHQRPRSSRPCCR